MVRGSVKYTYIININSVRIKMWLIEMLTLLMWPHISIDIFFVKKCAISTRDGLALGLPDKTKICGL